MAHHDAVPYVHTITQNELEALDGVASQTALLARLEEALHVDVRTYVWKMQSICAPKATHLLNGRNEALGDVLSHSLVFKLVGGRLLSRCDARQTRYT